ncbi:hypothetical protein C0416_01305 [bacterium]|nr:hypothetical protein [bacterium]
MKEIFNNPLGDRKVDKKSVDKSKQYLWRYIQKKKNLGAFAKEAKDAKTGFFATLFAPKKIAWASAIAVLTIIAVLVGPNLQNLLQSGIGTSQNIAYASFEMTPSNQDSTGIEANTKFTLTSTEDFDAALIEKNLDATPDVDINVSKTAEGIYEVVAAEPLNPNTVYTFSIISQNVDGPEEFSWAYQVKDDFKINGTLPGDKTTGVPVTSGIEINFSHEQFDIETAKTYVTISPAAEGNFEKYQRTLVFVPKNELNPGTIYTVTVKEGMPLTDSDKTLEEGKVFQFETATDSGNISAFHFNKDSFEIGTNQPIALKGYLSVYGDETEDEGMTTKTEVYSFADQSEYLSFVKEKNEVPTWTSYARSSYKIDVAKLNKVTEVEGQIGKVDWQDYLYLPDLDLKEGYYLVQADLDGHLTQCFLQITDLSSYITVTKTDSLVWVNDVKTDKPVENATITIAETGQTFKTDQNGIGKFKLNPEEYGYYTISIKSPEGKTLVTEIGVMESEIGAADYWAYMTTDRPVYLPTDKVQFWGFLKPRNDDAKMPEAKNITIKFERGWGNTLVRAAEYKMNSDLTFSGNIKLDDVPPGYYNVTLYDGEKNLMQQYIEVQTYKKPTYNIKLTSDKHAYFLGETIKYDVLTEFFDGTPMPNLKLTYTDNYRAAEADKKTAATNDLGKASIEIPTKESYPCGGEDSYCSDIDENYITVRPLLGEDSDILAEQSVRIFKTSLDLSIKTDTEEENAIVDISANWIDLNKINNEENDSYYDYLGKAAEGVTIKGTITERYWEKVETGEHYDFIEKRVIKDYSHEQRSNPFGTFMVETDSEGKAQYSFKMNPDKYYEIKFISSDKEGRAAHQTTYVYNHSNWEGDYFRVDITNGDQDGNKIYNINDTVEAAFTSDDSPIADLKGGKILFLQYSNGLLDYSIQSGATYSFKFEEKHVPGMELTGVWFDGETYNYGWSDYARLDTTTKELSVSINAEEASYEPGEKVKMIVEVTDKNGKPVQAEVLVNLVDEAYYKAVYDAVSDPMTEIYRIPFDGVLSTYSTHESEKSMMTGDMGGCFTADTKILMKDGSYKAIKNIKEGDIVMTKRSPMSNEMVAGKVTGTVEHLVSNYLVINENLEVTKEHVLFINGQWNLAESIKVGDTLIDKNSQPVSVFSVRKVTKPVYVYNFEVEKYHTYIANDIYVHNDKGGDGVRSDFEDTAIFQSVSTNGQGKATVEFQLPDNVTTWRAMATAIQTDKILVGSGVGAVKVTLPLFGDLIMNKEYSVKDSPIIGVRAFGESLGEDNNVSFKLTANEESQDAEGKAFKASYLDLPDLSKGTHTIQLDVSANGKKDALSEDIIVRGSRLNKSVVKVVPTVTGGSDIPLPESGYAEVYLMDAGVSSYYGSLLNLYYSHGERFEKRLGEQAAIELLKEYFGQDFTPHYDDDLLSYQRENGGLAMLPYADADLELTALTLAFDNNPGRYSKDDLKAYLEGYYLNKDSNLEDIVLSLLGLASLHEPVLTSLQAIQNEEKLSTLDKFYLGLAFKRLGSKSEADNMLKKAVGEMDEKSVHENALATVLAASLQYKEKAVGYWNNALFYADEDDLLSLYLLGYAREGLAYASKKDVSFNVSVANVSEKKTLKFCETFGALVSSSDGIKITDIVGDLAAVSFYEESVEPSQFKRDDRLKITRSYQIVGDPERSDLHVDDIVKITLNFSVAEDMQDKSYHVVDVLPSGLQPLAKPTGFVIYGYYITGPYKIHNQEVHFQYYPGKSAYDYGESVEPVKTYYAKVIHPGQFYADPAKIEVFENPEIANISDAKNIIIK